MATIIPFSGNTHKTPQAERLTPHEAPMRKRVIDVVDVAVASLYPHAVRAHRNQVASLAIRQQTAEPESTASNVREIASHPSYQWAGTENNPSMAQLAREAIGDAQSHSAQGNENAQKAA